MKSVKGKDPDDSGRHLIYAMRILPNGDSSVFRYIAHFDVDNNTWYKYDPFDNNYVPTEPLDASVIEWFTELPLLSLP